MNLGEPYETPLIVDWHIKHSGAGMTIVGKDFETGKDVTVCNVDRIEARPGDGNGAAWHRLSFARASRSDGPDVVCYLG